MSFRDVSFDKKTLEYEVLIIGAGASGLFCAMTAAKRGKKVCVLDHANKAGKKILMSGGGRCNFTNYDVTPLHYVGQNQHFCKSALSRYLNWDFIALVNAYGIAYDEKEQGQLFCQNSAKDILDMLLSECEKYGVVIALNTKIHRIEKSTAGFFVETTTSSKKSKEPSPINTTYSGQKLVIATGGLSIPTMGATGFGYQVATQFGHALVPTEAGLVPFTFTDATGEAFKRLAGTAVAVRAFNEKISFHLPVLFTHRGLSGPAMLQLSNYWRLGEPIFIDWLPTFDVAEFLLAQKTKHPKKRIRTVLETLPDPLPKKLLAVLEELLWQKHSSTALADLKDELLTQLGAVLNAHRLLPSGTEGYRTAEVTLGGVSTAEISSKTMESQRCAGLYFIGEVLDVTGHLGGYNFQWAWASGHACGVAV